MKAKTLLRIVSVLIGAIVAGVYLQWQKPQSYSDKVFYIEMVAFKKTTPYSERNFYFYDLNRAAKFYKFEVVQSFTLHRRSSGPLKEVEHSVILSGPSEEAFDQWRQSQDLVVLRDRYRDYIDFSKTTSFLATANYFKPSEQGDYVQHTLLTYNDGFEAKAYDKLQSTYKEIHKDVGTELLQNFTVKRFVEGEPALSEVNEIAMHAHSDDSGLARVVGDPRYAKTLKMAKELINFDVISVYMGRFYPID